MNYLVHHPILLTLAILVGLIVYGNIAWMICYVMLNKTNWFSNLLHFGDPAPANINAIETFGVGLFWPGWIITVIVFWYFWLLFGGLCRKVIGEKLNISKEAVPHLHV